MQAHQIQRQETIMMVLAKSPFEVFVIVSLSDTDLCFVVSPLAS